MIIELLSTIGGSPVRLEASQFVVRNDDGTPVMAGGLYGPAGAIKVAIAGDHDFEAVLRTFGYGAEGNVIIDHLAASKPPPGALLVAGPGISSNPR